MIRRATLSAGAPGCRSNIGGTYYFRYIDHSWQLLLCPISQRRPAIDDTHGQVDTAICLAFVSLGSGVLLHSDVPITSSNHELLALGSLPHWCCVCMCLVPPPPGGATFEVVGQMVTLECVNVPVCGGRRRSEQT